MRGAVAALGFCVAVISTLGCSKAAPPSSSSAPEPPKPVLVQVTDRLPPPGATTLDLNTHVKTLKPGLEGVAAEKEPEFSGYGYTFYSKDYRDTGTSLEMKTWGQTTAFERQILAGRKPREVVRVWDCAKRKSRREPCEVFDYTIFGWPPNSQRNDDERYAAHRAN